MAFWSAASCYMAQDQWHDENTDWSGIETVTRMEIRARGLSPERVTHMLQSDAEHLTWILLAFQWERARERRQRVQ